MEFCNVQENVHMKIDGKDYARVFEIGNGIHVFSMQEESPCDVVKGMIFAAEDIFVHLSQKRAATQAELHAAIASKSEASIPESEASYATIRMLSGIKPKRVAKAKAKPEVIRELSVSSEDEEEDEEEDESEEEEEDED